MIKHIHLDQCDSTQDVLKEQLNLHASNQEILVSCDLQTQGRGRGDNKWDPLPGSLFLSLTITPSPEPSFTAIEMSVLVTQFFEGSKLSLKWPNDIWNVQKKKCCGILVQTYKREMIAGIGLNLCSDRPEFGGVYDSYFEFDKKSWSMELARFIQMNRYTDIKKLKADWEARCGHMNDWVRISEGKEETAGVFLGLGSYGEAVLKTETGEEHLFNGSLRPLNLDH